MAWVKQIVGNIGIGVLRRVYEKVLHVVESLLFSINVFVLRISGYVLHFVNNGNGPVISTFDFKRVRVLHLFIAHLKVPLS